MGYAQVYAARQLYIDKYIPYERLFWNEFDYTILSNMAIKRYPRGRGKKVSYNDVIIMGDTETSKKVKIQDNHVVAWTISINMFERNIVTLYGNKPSDMIECIIQIVQHLPGERTFMYFHNLSYDWVFLRRFFFAKFGNPISQLNTKSHYPINIQWEHLILRDSLILAQRSLDKWAKDLNVEHQKAIGKWDYDKLRNQDEVYNDDELEYIEHDTLAGVECILETMNILNKTIASMPYTATGIPREECRKLGGRQQRRSFLKLVPTYEQYIKLLRVYHGGYCHGNRHFINTVIDSTLITGVDFASDYPFCLLAYKYPMSPFRPFRNLTPEELLSLVDTYALTFKLVLVRPRLKDDFTPMPALQYSKMVKSINPVLDNGRLLCGAYCEIYLTEQDFVVINEQYEWDACFITEVEYAEKDYLPDFFRDYVFKLFVDKTMLKGGDDPVAYALAKAKLNSVYGMCVQQSIRTNYIEDYKTGEYYAELQEEPEELYQKFIDNNNSFLPYQWGVYCTAYAFKRLFDLGKLAGTWLYSDTDSCYGTDWDMEGLEAFNNEVKQQLKDAGYGAVHHNGRDYFLGCAEIDGVYSEFKYQGAKRYCARDKESGKLKITVAGVPKKGVECLKDDIDNFKPGMIFDGNVTGKLTHKYIYVDDIYIDENGNETGDSIDLSKCDYLLDSIDTPDWERIFQEEIEIQVYDENDLIRRL